MTHHPKVNATRLSWKRKARKKNKKGRWGVGGGNEKKEETERGSEVVEKGVNLIHSRGEARNTIQQSPLLFYDAMKFGTSGGMLRVRLDTTNRIVNILLDSDVSNASVFSPQ